MQIYFACSITGGRKDEAVYQTIVDTLLADGHVVPTAILALPEVVALEQVSNAAAIYARDIAWIQESDVLVAEISTPSHGVGYEIGYALGLGKQVLCLHRAGERVSKMITGNPAPNLTVRAYSSPEEAVTLVRTFTH
ncbi:MAG TPA: nucleoside 2-deoxyribosyltransferase [Anaerolineales bacterium]|jgi:nucleoside 2-deoxyribosyltransferase|nr:nucleoside 2-deoxyribosyltransferase [Anaerolineales bacterium]